MPHYDGKRVAHEALLDVAKHCAQAALHAPQITGTTDIKIEILVGEELEHFFYVQDELNKLKITTTGERCKVAYDMGEPPTVLLLGADGSRSETAWDCGACGFDNCRDFNNYSHANLGWGWWWKGPNCIWKALEFGIACDWAAAAAHNYNIENRVQMITGGLFLRMGYLEGCTMAIALPLGPCREHWYFEPGSRLPGPPYEAWTEFVMTMFPNLNIQFEGPGRDSPGVAMKTKDKFWERPKRYLRVVEYPEFEQIVVQRYPKLIEAINVVRKRRGLAALELSAAEKALIERERKLFPPNKTGRNRITAKDEKKES